MVRLGSFEPSFSGNVAERPVVVFSSVYDAETDEDEPQSKKKTFKLVDFFHDKHFFVFDDDYDEGTLHDIRRVIYAYDGTLEKQMTADVQYIITNRLWNSHFEKVGILVDTRISKESDKCLVSDSEIASKTAIPHARLAAGLPR